MYKLFTDVDKSFKCKIDVGGVSLNKCKARIILESKALNLLYNGVVNENGTCEVFIHRLRNLLENGSQGKIKLEVIADNTVFVPWESDFTVETKKSVRVTEIVSEDDDSRVLNESEKKVTVKVMLDEGEMTQRKKPLQKNIDTKKKVVKETFETAQEKTFQVSETMKKHIRMLEEQMKNHHINDKFEFERMFEQYADITSKHGILS